CGGIRFCAGLFKKKRIVFLSRGCSLPRFGVRVTCHRFVRCRLVDITQVLGERFRVCMVVEGFIDSIIATIDRVANTISLKNR
ncbi:MAG TPA: hypothetical protein VGP47_07310, partial [Parachlamydiaceae bacterium]|nr:hypothetical protein [Parachlamydiaceae bacterium]